MTNETNTMTNEEVTFEEGNTVEYKGERFTFDGLTKKGRARLIDQDGKKSYANLEDLELVEIKAKGMAATLERYKPGYKPCTAYSGASSQNNGDPIAEALEGKDPGEVMAWAEKLLGMKAGSLNERYERLNPGQKRMNSGNLVRNAVKRGDLDIKAIA